MLQLRCEWKLQARPILPVQSQSGTMFDNASDASEAHEAPAPGDESDDQYYASLYDALRKLDWTALARECFELFAAEHPTAAAASEALEAPALTAVTDVANLGAEEEELEDLPLNEKSADPFNGAGISREIAGTIYKGVVEDIEQGMVSKVRLYRICYEDGDREHFTMEQMQMYLDKEGGDTGMPKIAERHDCVQTDENTLENSPNCQRLNDRFTNAHDEATNTCGSVQEKLDMRKWPCEDEDTSIMYTDPWMESVSNTLQQIQENGGNFTEHIITGGHEDEKMRQWTIRALAEGHGGLATDAELLDEFVAEWHGEVTEDTELEVMEAVDCVQRVWTTMDREGTIVMTMSRDEGKYELQLVTQALDDKISEMEERHDAELSRHAQSSEQKVESERAPHQFDAQHHEMEKDH